MPEAWQPERRHSKNIGNSAAYSQANELPALQFGESRMSVTDVAPARVELVDIPPSLMRDDLDRRLPSGGRFRDISGEKFSFCEVIGFAGFLKQYAAWLCKCDCGNLFVTRQGPLVFRGRASCGCETLKSLTTHGLSQTVEYTTWMGMLDRCTNKNSYGWSRYGGRGIKVCKRWRESPAAFVDDMGKRPSDDHSIERKDNDANYSCGKCSECRANGWVKNCIWATRWEQLANKSAGRIRMITHNGVTKPMSLWAFDIGISRERMRQRVNICIERGIDVSEALTTPAGEAMPSAFRRVPKHYKKRTA